MNFYCGRLECVYYQHFIEVLSDQLSANCFDLADSKGKVLCTRWVSLVY